MEMNTIIDPGSGMPLSTTATMPTITGTAGAMQQAPVTALTPQDINRPLPSIVNTQPENISPPCAGFTQWVNDNPLWAGLMLVGVGILMFGHGGKGK